MTQTEKLIKMCSILPECCSPFLLETGTETAITSRLAYAWELNSFFDYMISYNPIFCELKKNEIQLDDIKKITSQDISRYLTIYKDNEHKERTVARKRAALSSYFAYLAANRNIEYNPVLAATKVKIHQSDEVVHLDFEEQIQFLNTVSNGSGLDSNKLKYHEKYKKRDFALVFLLLDTGMRVSELRGVDIVDIDFTKCSVIVTRKGGNNQTLYFSDDTRDALEDYLEERMRNIPDTATTDPFFVTLKGNRLAVRSIEMLIKKYSLASLPGKGDNITPHKMRSSFAMSYYRETKDILSLQRKLGHKALAATNIYAKATDKEMEETRSILAEKRKEISQKSESAKKNPSL